MSKTPSTLLSDALTSFNRAATLAFTTAQDQAHKDVTQAATEAREARKERDEAVNALHASRLEEQAWKQEAGVWKATATQAELTINHHRETITQLRQEATQWKNQCLRLEETSRQEAISWKEQFLRVEQERSKLAERVEELVAEQLDSGEHAQASTTPYTPMTRRRPMVNQSMRLGLIPSFLRSGAQERAPSKSTSSICKPLSSANRTRPGPISQLPTPLSENQRNARQRVTQEAVTPVSQPGLSSNGARQTLIRRVQAVVEVPVKEESVERDVGPDTCVSSSTSTSVPKSSKAPHRFTALNKAPRKMLAKRTYVEIDDEESEPDDVSQDSKQSDEEEQPVPDDDDELLMGVETNRKEVYGMKRVPNPTSLQKTTRPLVVAEKRKAPLPHKKSRPSATSKP